MFSIKGKGIVIPLDQPFEIDGVRYASSWLRHSTQAERDALDIVETPDAPSFDSRFYWDTDISKEMEDEEITEEYDIIDEEGNEVTQTRTYTQYGLKSNWVSQIKQTTNQLLQNTDWYITRKYERNIDVPEKVVEYREAVHTESARLEEAILGTATVEELIDIVTHQNWPNLN